MVVLALALVGAFSVSACQTPEQQRGTLIGGGLGAGAGALIGSAVSHGSPAGVLAGAVIGGVGGGMVGHHVTRPRHCIRRGYDSYGNRVCVAWS